MDRLDSIAMAILPGLMLRHGAQGFSDEASIHEAYRLAELVVAQKKAHNSDYAKCTNCGSAEYKQVTKLDNECLGCGTVYRHFA